LIIEIVNVIVNEMPNSKAGNHLSGQLDHSGASVSLNYREAQSSESKIINNYSITNKFKNR